MTNKEYVLQKHTDDLLSTVYVYGLCELCHAIGCSEYCKSPKAPHSCEETFKSWLEKEHNSIHLDLGEIVEVKLPTDTQLCYYAGKELGVHYFTNSKKTCDQIKTIGLKSISKADLIVLLDCDLPLCISKVGD